MACIDNCMTSWFSHWRFNNSPTSRSYSVTHFMLQGHIIPPALKNMCSLQDKRTKTACFHCSFPLPLSFPVCAHDNKAPNSLVRSSFCTKNVRVSLLFVEIPKAQRNLIQGITCAKNRKIWR